MTKCCWAGIATGSYKKVMCAKQDSSTQLDYENISFLGTKYILDHKRPKTIT